MEPFSYRVRSLPGEILEPKPDRPGPGGRRPEEHTEFRAQRTLGWRQRHGLLSVLLLRDLGMLLVPASISDSGVAARRWPRSASYAHLGPSQTHPPQGRISMSNSRVPTKCIGQRARPWLLPVGRFVFLADPRLLRRAALGCCAWGTSGLSQAPPGSLRPRASRSTLRTSHVAGVSATPNPGSAIFLVVAQKLDQPTRTSSIQSGTRPPNSRSHWRQYPQCRREHSGPPR
jgi:hypothetical protein